MNEDLRSFLINIAASIFLIVATTIVAKLVQIAPSRRLWRLSDPKKLHICMSTSARTDTGEYVRFSSGIGQIRALALIAPSLHRSYKEFDEQRILMSEDMIADRYEGDLIILGGPKNNKVARDILTELAPLLPGTVQEPKIVWKTDAEPMVFDARRSENDIEEDYGVIIRAANPYNSKRKVILLAGAHTYGTTAAARLFLCEFRKLKHVFLGDFMAIAKARVKDRHVAEPTLVCYQRLKART